MFWSNTLYNPWAVFKCAFIYTYIFIYVFPLCGSFSRWEHIYRGRRPHSASKWTVTWFDCSQKAMRLSVDPTAGSQPSIPCVMSCSSSFTLHDLRVLRTWMFFLGQNAGNTYLQKVCLPFLSCFISDQWMNPFYTGLLSTACASANVQCDYTKKIGTSSLWFKTGGSLNVIPDPLCRI